jgi:IS1 family transposase
MTISRLTFRLSGKWWRIQNLRSSTARSDSSKVMNSKCLAPQELCDHLSREIASLNTDDFGRRTKALGQVHEIQKPEHISTSFVERQNLTMRMSMRRFTRLPIASLRRLRIMSRRLRST